MKKKEVIKTVIREFHLRKKFDVKKRELDIPINSGKIITLIGARRSGKSSCFYYTINQLTKTINKEQIIFINFEDERLDLKLDELDLILQGYLELYPENNLEDCYIFFDEIQNIDGWEKFVRRVYDTITKNIFITGSNSKLLSSEIATSLRGRTLTFNVYPLSFREFLDFKNIEIDFYTTKSKALIKTSLESYLLTGGFPELCFVDSKYHIKILQEYFDVMIFKDLIQRYNITNIVALKFFLKRLIASSTKELSVNKIYNELKSNGIKIGKNTLYDFLEYAQNIFLAFLLPKYTTKLINKELGDKKIYSIDMGLNRAIDFSFTNNLGKALENAVFLELIRREKEPFYYTNKKSECDFVIKEQNSFIPIQVALNIEDEDTKKREIKGLIEVCKELNLNKGFIITLDTQDEFEINGIKIEVIPFYKWA